MLSIKRPKTRVGHRKISRQPREEQGQGLVEAAVSLLFLLLIIVVTFEMLFVFLSYISLTNAAAQGAIQAAGHPGMAPGDGAYDDYIADIQGEALAGGLNWTDVNVHPPLLPANVVQGEPITVTIDYTMTTPFSELVLPMFGRFGMPTEYHITAWNSVPIR